MNKFEQQVNEITEAAGWIRYIGWDRKDLDFAMYKNVNANAGSRRFLRVKKEGGAWEIASSKRNSAEVIRQGEFVGTLPFVLTNDPVTTPTELMLLHDYDYLVWLRKTRT